MAFQLTRTGPGEFSVTPGAQFTVEVKPANGGPNFIVHSVCYADVCLNAAPFTFTAVSGLKGLTAVFDWDQIGEFVRLSEIDGGGERSLRLRRYNDEEPFCVISIKG
jgi:hypothetical protein